MNNLIPESLTQNSLGRVFKSKNDLRKLKRNSGGLLIEDLKNIKQSKKLANKRVKSKDIAYEKNKYNAGMYSKNTLTLGIIENAESLTFERLKIEKKKILNKQKRKGKKLAAIK